MDDKLVNDDDDYEQFVTFQLNNTVNSGYIGVGFNDEDATGNRKVFSLATVKFFQKNIYCISSNQKQQSFVVDFIVNCEFQFECDFFFEFDV